MLLAGLAWWVFGAAIWLSQNRNPPPGSSRLIEESDEWPPLTDSQVTEWAEQLTKNDIKTVTVLWSPEVNAKRLYKSFKKAAEQAKVEINTGLGGTNYHGIEMVAEKDDPSSPVFLGLVQELTKSAKLNTDPSEGGKKGEVFLLVGEKP